MPDRDNNRAGGFAEDYDPFLKMVKVGRCLDHGSVERKFCEECIGRAMGATPELERVSHHQKRE